MVINEISLNLERVLTQLLPQQKLDALERAGQLVENNAKQKCGVQSGVLRASITHEVEADKVTIGTNVEYAPYHHLNNEFLQESLDENMDGILNCFTRLLGGGGVNG